MKIKLPKPINRDVNFLDANSRKAAGAFRDKRPQMQAQILMDELDEIFGNSFDALVDVEDEDT